MDNSSALNVPAESVIVGLSPDESETVDVLISKEGTSTLPTYAHPGDAGLDLASTEDVVIEPLGRATVGTGISIALPPGVVGLVHPRSGLAARHGITVLNSPGTVDAGYRGEIRVTLHNTDPETSFHVRPGDRIAQLVIQSVLHANLIEVDHLPGSHRGEGGFGSTGGFAPESEGQ